MSESNADTTSISDPVEGFESSVEDPALANQQSDTLVLDKKSVIFFMLNQQEYDSLMIASGDDATDVNEGISDFAHYAEVVSQQMKERGIHSEIVSHKVFKILKNDEIEYFNRKKASEADMGILIFDGETKSTIETGVRSDVDFLMLIEEKIR